MKVFKSLATKVLASKVLKGYLTWTSLVGVLLPVFNEVTHANVLSTEVQAVVAGVGAAGVVVGKLRAVYQAQQGV